MADIVVKKLSQVVYKVELVFKNCIKKNFKA